MRFLVVDDDRIFARTVGRLLRRMGAVPTLATGPLTAIDWIERAPFDVVLCDAELAAGVTGLEVLAHARERLPGAMRVLMSVDVARWRARDIAPGLVERLLPKPFRIDELAALRLPRPL